MNFLFVTPQEWDGKEKWRKEKEALGEWKSVRVYDSRDLELWIENSLQAQRWLSEKIGIAYEGVYSLEDRWHSWASVTEPELSQVLFATSVELRAIHENIELAVVTVDVLAKLLDQRS